MMMNFCFTCGQDLPLGREKFCPNCGEKLDSPEPSKKSKGGGNSIAIHGNKGEIIGTDISGKGNFIGKEIAYTVKGNIINFHVSNLSTDVV